MRGQGRARVSNIMYKEATSRDTLSHDIAQSYRVRLLAPEIETEDEEMIEREHHAIKPIEKQRNIICTKDFHKIFDKKNINRVYLSILELMIQCPMTIPGGNPGHDSSQNYQLIFVIKHQHLRWFFSHFMFEGMQPLHLWSQSAFSLSYHCQSYSSQYSSQFLYQEVAEVTDTKLFNHFLNNFYSEINKSWWSSDQTRGEVLEESVYWRTAISSCARGQILGFYDGNNWMLITLHNYNLIIRSLEGHNSFIEIKETFERCFIFLLLSPTFLFDKLVLIFSTTIEVKDRRYEKYFFFQITDHWPVNCI